MIFLFYQDIIFDEGGYKEETIKLRPSLYDIECFGAQGGDSYSYTNRDTYTKLKNGGPGSYAHAKIKVAYSNISLSVEIGAQGYTDSGGQPDGGDPAKYDTYPIKKPGSGGGSSRVSLGDIPLIVAAGGSGASITRDGSPGGGNNTCFYKERGNDNYFETSEKKYMTGNRNGGPGKKGLVII